MSDNFKADRDYLQDTYSLYYSYFQSMPNYGGTTETVS